jgi:hypothetical protein
MKKRCLLLSLFMVLVIAVTCSAQQAIPSPALENGTLTPNSIFAGYSLGVKDSNLDLLNGVLLSYSQLVKGRWGFTLESSGQHSPTFSYSDFGVRLGPEVLILSGVNSDLFAHALMGGSTVKASYTNNLWKGSVSFAAGMGTEFKMAGPLNAKMGVDFILDPTSEVKTRYVRAVIGTSYRWGIIKR